MRLHCLCACYGQMLLAYKSQYAGLRKELLRDSWLISSFFRERSTGIAEVCSTLATAQVKAAAAHVPNGAKTQLLMHTFEAF
jgi:hypothetical protein